MVKNLVAMQEMEKHGLIQWVRNPLEGGNDNHSVLFLGNSLDRGIFSRP